MPKRSVCIHAHFYQPSREDPLTGEIPVEMGASPYDNWNDRIFADCYAPNAAIGNFQKISFNVGPTLTKWMRSKAPQTLAQIIAADHENTLRYGVGNAMAQPYHHTILPLASRREKQIQVAWGIADFVHTFGRQPEGMWLPETAVDLETLDVLAGQGIRFTVLAPWQAEGIIPDPFQPYLVNIPGGRTITVFFYDSGLSSEISFDPSATSNADGFVKRFVHPRFSKSDKPEMLMVASDGELYGHHQAFREKFLARLLDSSLVDEGYEPSYPGRWLSQNEIHEVISISENTSWSCQHGVERWRGECGCTPGGSWKAPLRQAMKRVAEMIDAAFEEYAAPYFSNPWNAVERYSQVMLEQTTADAWLSAQSLKPLDLEEKLHLKSLFEAQLERQRMFTSCGWFFEDFDRIEPRNNVTYAAHAVWLAERASRQDLYSEAVRAFGGVVSPITGLKADDVFSTAYYRFSNRS
jgi:alpha-amylase/alpha-mannosidase (GH57 family)